MARRLEVEIVGDARSYERTLNRAGGATSGFGRTFGRTAKVVTAAAATVAVAVTAGFVGTLKQGFDELAEGQKVSAQTAAVLKSTGGAANITAREVEGLAGKLSAVSGIDDELIQKGENLLLTFKNVRNEVGEGNKVFDRATQSALDLSVAGFGSVESASKMLGKALNDPARGMTALRRAGVTFTAQQEKTIKSLDKSGRSLEAQKVMLAEVESQVGGSARAYGQTLPGQLSRLRNSFDETAGNLARRFLPALTGVLGFVNDDLLPGFGRAADFIGGFWERVSKDFVQAKGVRAKIEVVWEGVRELAQSVADEVSAAMPDVDWKATGQAIVDGIIPAIEGGAELAKAFADLVSDTLDQVNWEQVGRKAGPFLAAMIASAFASLTDPAFWARNWDLALAIGLTVFGGAVGRFAGRALAVVGRRLIRLGEDLALAIAGGIERFAPRLGTAFITAVTAGARLLAGALGRVWGIVESAASGVWSRMGPLLRGALTLGWIAALASAISAAGQFITGKAVQFYNWSKGIGTALVDGLADGIRAGVDKIKAAIDWVTDKIPGFIKGPLGISSPSRVTMDIGRDLAEGLGIGFGLGSVTVEQKLADRISGMVDRMVSAVQSGRSDLASAFSDLASSALAGFDAITGGHESPTEKKMRLEDEARADRDRRERLKEARRAFQEAAAAGDPEAVAAAQREINEAEFAIQRAADEKKAALERKGYEDRRALRRRHFEEELSDLAALADRKGFSAEQVNKRLLGIFKRYGVPFRNAGNTLGLAIAEGISDAAAAVARGASKLRKSIITHLGAIEVTINIAGSGKPPTGPGRAGGGRVWPGVAFPVGERGRELYVPDQAGRIIPHGQTEALLAGAGAGALPTVNIERYYAQSDRDAELIASAVARRFAFR